MVVAAVISTSSGEARRPVLRLRSQQRRLTAGWTSRATQERVRPEQGQAEVQLLGSVRRDSILAEI